MFQFPAFAPHICGLQSSTAGVPPFGHLRINSCLQIPGAFRSLPRPSSLPEAKASSVRSCSLSRTFQVNTLRHLRLNSYSFAFEIAVPYTQLEKTRICYTDYNLFNFFYLVISLSIVNDLKMCIHSCYPLYKIKTDYKYKEV